MLCSHVNIKYIQLKKNKATKKNDLAKRYLFDKDEYIKLRKSLYCT